MNSGAFVVSGGVGIMGNTYIGGNLIVNGNIFMNGILAGTGGGSVGSGSGDFGTNPLTAGNIIVGKTTVNTLLSTSPYFNINTSTLLPSSGLNLNNSVTVYNTLVLAGGSSGSPLVSSNNSGTTWSGVSQSVISTVLGTAFGSIGTGTSLVGLWIAVGTGSNTIAYSYDGTTWNGAGSPLASATGVAYGAGMFIAYGKSATAAYSTNGSTWTTFTLYNSATYVISIAYGNGTWGALCYTTQVAVLYSTNGTTWYAYFSPSTGTGYGCIAFLNRFWVYAIKYSGNPNSSLYVDSIINNYTSTSFSSSTLLINIYSTAYGGGILVLVGLTSGSGSIAYATFSSVSTINFTMVSNSVALIGSTGISVSYTNGQFIAMGSTGSTAVSTNGTTWTAGGYTGLTTGNTIVSGYGNTVSGNTLYSISLSSYQNNLLVSGSVNVGTNALSAGNISVYSGVVSFASAGTMSVGSLVCTTQTTGSLVATVGITAGTVTSASIVQNTTSGGISAYGSISMASISSTYPEFVAGGTGTTHTLAYASNTGINGQTMGTWTGNLNTIFNTQVNQIANFTIGTSSGSIVNPGATIFVAVGQGTNTLAYSYDGIKWTGLGTTIFSNDAISIASGYIYSGTTAVGPYMFAIGSNTNSFNSVAISLDGVNWNGSGKSGFGLANVDSSCKIVYVYDTFIVFGGGTYANVKYLNISTGWNNMGTSFSSLGMTMTGLCYYNGMYYSVGAGATHTMATVTYSGGGTAAGTYGTWTGCNKTAIAGSAQGVVYVPTQDAIITVGTNISSVLVVNFSNASSFGSGTTVTAASINIGLAIFTGISTFALFNGLTWVLIYGTTNVSNASTLWYTNNYSSSINSSSTWTGTLGSNVFYNGSTATSTCTYALLGTAMILPISLFSMTTAGNMTVSGNISIGGNISCGGNISISGNIFCSKGIAYVGSIQNTSDYRIKANVELLGSEFSVSKLVPVKYYNTILRKDDVGFIAHEIQDVFPQFVEGEKDGENYQSVNYTGLIAILVKEIQHLKQENIEIRQELREIRQAMS